MIGEKNQNTLEQIKILNVFTDSEVDLINFIIKNGREPNYVDERSQYQVLLRLRRKLRDAKAKVSILSDFFAALDDIKVSNKLVGRGVD